MAAQPGYDRRVLLRGGLAATAAGAIGLGAAGTAAAAPAERPAAARPARARAAEPRIYGTDEWGARAASDTIVIEDHVPTYIVVHHTANPGNSTDYSLEHAKQICRDIQNFHMDGNGWIDTGQQFTNSRGGYRLEGRHKSLSAVRGGVQHVQGANVGGHNSEVIGIENEGLYTDVDVPQALWDSLVDLVAWIADQYGNAMANIRGHRDFNSTECPGDVLYGRLQELRDAVAGRLAITDAAPFVAWPLLRPDRSARRSGRPSTCCGPRATRCRPTATSARRPGPRSPDWPTPTASGRTPAPPCTTPRRTRRATWAPTSGRSSRRPAPAGTVRSRTPSTRCAARAARTARSARRSPSPCGRSCCCADPEHGATVCGRGTSAAAHPQPHRGTPPPVAGPARGGRPDGRRGIRLTGPRPAARLRP